MQISGIVDVVELAGHIYGSVLWAVGDPASCCCCNWCCCYRYERRLGESLKECYIATGWSVQQPGRSVLPMRKLSKGPYQSKKACLIGVFQKARYPLPPRPRMVVTHHRAPTTYERRNTEVETERVSGGNEIGIGIYTTSSPKKNQGRLVSPSWPV